ncbi:MAG: hypothetical protein JJU36_18180 [Phycisphaeraceae bacterium]|nr:hypothetical protein [Phycisphaeraceae bacterium]
MPKTLTSQERVHRMFERQDHDRVPRHDTFWWETIERWRGEGLEDGQNGALAELESDFHCLCWNWPAPWPGREELIEEDERTRIIIDQFGQKARYWKGRSGTPEHLGWACQSSDDWHGSIRRQFLETPLHVQIDEVAKAFDRARAQNQWTYLSGAESFEMTRKLMGDEVTLIAMATEPEWIIDVSKVHTDLLIRDYQAILDAGIQPDGLFIYGDMAFNHATMCSPAMYRQLIWPDHKRLADFAHENGMKMIYHTDGNINGVLDLYIEAGFDCVQPLEAKAGMDVRALAPKLGDRLALFGNVDVMVMATNDLSHIEAELVAKLKAGMATRGYAYHSDHSIPPSVSWQTYRSLIRLLDQHGNYH